MRGKDKCKGHWMNGVEEEKKWGEPHGRVWEKRKQGIEQSKTKPNS